MFSVDFDGVIANTNNVKSKWIRSHLDIDVPPTYCDRTSCVSRIGLSEYERMSQVVYSRESTSTTPPVSGAKDALVKLAAIGAVHVITARPNEWLPFTKEWLTSHGLMRYIEDVVSARGCSKVELAHAARCVVMIDDDVRHLSREGDSGLTLVLFKVGLKEDISVPRNVVVCSNWADVLTVARKAAGREG